MPQSGKLPVLNLLTGQKSFFFTPQGRLIASIHVKHGTADGHCVRLAVQNVTSIGVGGGNAAAKISKISTFS